MAEHETRQEQGKNNKKDAASESQLDQKVTEEAKKTEALVKKVTEDNKKIDDDFDEKLKRLDDKKKLNLDEDADEKASARIAKLREKLNELQMLISEARKTGKDPFIASLMLRNVKAKIQLAETTRDEKDYKAVDNILNNAREELEESKKEEELDVKKEIEEKLQHELAKKTGKGVEKEED